MKTIISIRLLISACLLILVYQGCNKKSELAETTFSGSLKSGTLVYLDPQYTGVKNGTMAQPFNSWADIVWHDGLTCLIKAGSTFNVISDLKVTGNQTTIGSYGTGARPHIVSTAVHVFDLGGLTDVTIQDLEIESTNNAQSCIHLFNNVRGRVINCKVHGSEWGIRNVNTTGMIHIINSEIFMTGDDGCFNETADSVELSGSYIHDVNQKWFVNPDPTYSGGDGFQMVNLKYFNIHNNTIDHGTTGNKFCIIAGGDGTVTSHGIIEHNILIRQGNDILIYMADADNVIVQYNKFENANIAIYNLSSNAHVYYNEFSNITGNVLMLGAPVGSVTTFLNNTFYNFNTLSNNYTNVVSFENNIFSNCYGTLFVTNTTPNADYNCYNQISTMGTASIGTHSIQADPVFTDVSTLQFKLQSGSPCIDKGVKILPSYFDMDGNAVPNGVSTDMGAHEFYGPVDIPPVVSITAPANGANFVAPATIQITANASDADGTISKVEFFNGTTKLGEKTVTPYSFTWSNVPTGRYSITAVATDNMNSKTTSNTVVAWVNQ